MEKDTLNLMFENLLHIGNKTNYWNPRMKRYIYGSVNGIHVINLVETEKKLEEVKKVLKELHTNGNKILFVGTKLQARDAVAKLASESGHFYVTEKWVPGLLTNFKTIKRRIATYMQLDKDIKTGALDILTKKEKAAKMLEFEKLDKAYKGVKEMKKTPDVIFVVDGVYEDQAIKEAKSLGLKTFAIISTNGDDTLIDYCIPANTNAVKSIDYIMSDLKESISGKVIPQGPSKGAAIKTDNSRFKKMDDKKVSGEKPTVSTKKEKSEEVKETPATKKETVKKEEKVEKETTTKKAPAKKEEPKAEKKTTAKAKKEEEKTK